MTDEVMDNISMGEAASFSDINPNENPMVLDTGQDGIVIDQIKQLEDPALKAKATAKYQAAKDSGRVKVTPPIPNNNTTSSNPKLKGTVNE